jgi:hypothetical protein
LTLPSSTIVASSVAVNVFETEPISKSVCASSGRAVPLVPEVVTSTPIGDLL